MIFLLLFSSCNRQPKSNAETRQIEEFNWTVNIHEDFEPINQEEQNKALKKGINAIKNTFEEGVNNQAITIFICRDVYFNNFEANWQPYGIEIDGNYTEIYSQVNEMVYQTFKTQMPDAKLDSISFTQKVSRLEFQRFDISINSPSGIKMKKNW